MWAVLFCVATKGTEQLLPVILNGAAGRVKDLGEQTVGNNRFFATAQNDRGGLSE